MKFLAAIFIFAGSFAAAFTLIMSFFSNIAPYLNKKELKSRKRIIMLYLTVFFVAILVLTIGVIIMFFQ